MQEKTERNKKIFKDKIEKGLTYGELVQKYGLSYGRVQNIFNETGSKYFPKQYAKWKKDVGEKLKIIK